MKIGELCERTGASKDTVRHYEKIGLLKPKYLPAGSREYRHYDETAVNRLHHIANGKQAGFSLREIQQGLDGLMDGTMDYNEQRSTLLSQMQRIDANIAKMRDAKRFLRSQIKRVDRHEARSEKLKNKNI